MRQIHTFTALYCDADVKLQHRTYNSLEEMVTELVQTYAVPFPDYILEGALVPDRKHSNLRHEVIRRRQKKVEQSHKLIKDKHEKYQEAVDYAIENLPEHVAHTLGLVKAS